MARTMARSSEFSAAGRFSVIAPQRPIVSMMTSAPPMLSPLRDLDHDVSGLKQSEIANVTDSRRPERVRAENRFPLFLIPL